MRGDVVAERWPYVLVACACAAGAIALASHRTAAFPRWTGAAVIESMTHRRPRRLKRSRHADALDHIDMPKRDQLIHFVSPTGGSACTDLAGESDVPSFALSEASAPAAPRWTGPSAKSVLPGPTAAPKMSVFVTLDGSADAVSMVSDGDRASLFMAYASDTHSSARGSASEKWVQLSVHAAEGADGHELRATYGDDVVSVAFPMLSHPRTCYLIRDERTLRVGYFDPNGRAEDASSVETRQGPVLPSEQPIVINATGARIGGIVSLIVYRDTVQDVMSQVRAGVARHALLDNAHYKTVRESLTSLNDEIMAQKRSPRYAGAAVADACADITDWTTFDPVLATQECRHAIRESCEDDPSQRYCKCWDDSFEQKESTECVALRAVFGDDVDKQPNAQATEAPLRPTNPDPVEQPLGAKWLRRSFLRSLLRPA